MDIEELLTNLIEECSEVIQAATKIQRFGRNEFYDNGQKNIDQLFEELNHVLAVWEMLCTYGYLQNKFDSEIIEDKKNKVIRYSKSYKVK